MINATKYLITRWIKEYDYDGVSDDFAILGEFSDLAEARKFVDAEQARAISELLDKKKEWGFMDLDSKTRPSFSDPNKTNHIVYALAEKIGDGTGYNSLYHYLDVIEVSRDAVIDRNMFNPERCDTEVDSYFKDRITLVDAPKSKRPVMLIEGKKIGAMTTKEQSQLADDMVLRANAEQDKISYHEKLEESLLIPRAIHLALQTHEIDQKQKRKGKNVPYIVHPLMVGMILAKAGAPYSVIAAGILHDTIEDSVPEKKVTYEMLKDQFGTAVADRVNDVTEQDKGLPWTERKAEAMRHIGTMAEASIWVKTADVISNVTELLADYKKDGDQTFDRFNAGKTAILANYRAVIDVLLIRWEHISRHPLALQLLTLRNELAEIV